MRGVRLCVSGRMADTTGGRADFDTWTCCFAAQVSVLVPTEVTFIVELETITIEQTF